MGEIPDWFRYIKASKLCPAVKPWEWLDKPLVWMEWVFASAQAEENTQKQLDKMSAKSTPPQDLPESLPGSFN